MKHVPARWLYVLHSLLLISDVLLIAGFAYLRLTHASAASVAHWGIAPGIVALAGAHLFYGTLAYPWLQRKYLWQTTLVSFLLFDVLLAAVLQTSGGNNNIYHAAWIVMVSGSALLGPYLLVAEIGVITVLDIFEVLGLFRPRSGTGTVTFILLGAAYAAGAVSWLICRRYYTEPAGRGTRLDALSQLLSSEEQRSNIIIESITDGVIAINTEGKISLINVAAADMTQWPVGEALGIDINLVMKLTKENGEALTAEDNPFALALSQKRRLNQNLVLVGRKNKKQTVSLALSPLLLPKTQALAGAIAVFRDISEARAEERQRAEFISTASHEMRTPVAAIEGYLSLALNGKVSSIDTKAREFLEKAHESTQRLGKLFQDLLTSSRAEDGRLANHPAVIEMGSYLQKLTEDLRFAAAKKGLAMEFVIGSEELVDATSAQGGNRVVRPLYFVHADPDRLREVVTNLFDNAVKYTDQGKISIGLTGNDSVVQFYVRDSGPGIPAGDIQHLFQKFYRVDNSATRSIGGTGLGLFICHKIIELAKGRIWVESTEGKGSTFFINLPRLTAAKAAELQAAEASSTKPLAI